MKILIGTHQRTIRMDEFTTEELVSELIRRNCVEHIKVTHNERCEIAVDRMDAEKEYVGANGEPTAYRYDQTFEDRVLDVIIVFR